jgi:hypothetical protein
MSAGRTILFLPQNSSSFREMFPIAEALQEGKVFQPKFVFSFTIAEEQRGRCDSAGTPYLLVEVAEEQAQSRRVGVPKKHFRALQIARQFLLILMGDRHVGLETALVRLANEKGVPSLIVPVALSTPEVAAQYRLRQPHSQAYTLHTPLHKLAAMLFPHWVYQYRGQALLFYPLWEALSAWALGLMPPNPWALGGGHATRMAVESPRLKEMFAAQGVPESKMVITGKPSMDDITDLLAQSSERRAARCMQLGIDPAKRIILCSPPQMGEHKLLSWDEHWEQIDFLLRTLTSFMGCQVVLTLHPKSRLEDYQPRAQRYGAIIAQDASVYELIPLCDVFVATYSSTVVAAIGAHKPVVVVDFTDLSFPFYNDCAGVEIIRQPDELRATLQRMLDDPAYYASLVEAQEAQAGRWALLDGQATLRVLDVIDELTNRRSPDERV